MIEIYAYFSKLSIVNLGSNPRENTPDSHQEEDLPVQKLTGCVIRIEEFKR